MNLQTMIAGLDVENLTTSLMESRWQVHHGSIERFPAFLRPDDGALSSIGKLANWPQFHVAYRDGTGNYHQVKGAAKSAAAYYDEGALITSRAIEGASDAAKVWLEAWALALRVPRDHLRLNSWAARGTSGIDWHFDYEDVVHFQIKGDKLFKLLATPHTRFADKQTKIFERIMAAEQSFAEASEQIVKEGTITIIPRGVWHWSEAKSDESFAVSLCIASESCSQILLRALHKRLRLMERFRRPVLGSSDARREALAACMEQSVALLQAMDSMSVVSQECQPAVPIGDIDRFYFYLGSRANARLAPMRMLVDGKALNIEGDDNKRAIFEAICKMGHGFRVRDIGSILPGVDSATIVDTVVWLVSAGFLDFVDAKLDGDRSLAYQPLS